MKKITLLMLIVFSVTTHGQNKLLSSIDEYYNGSSWQNSSGYNYEYDSNNNLIAETYLDWYNGAWVINNRTIYTYDASNKVTTAVFQDWNDVTNQFENTEKENYTYVNGKITEILSETWENSQWELDGKFTLGYDSNNLLTVGLGHSWDGSQWINEDRELLTYNPSNQLIGDFGETLVNSQWENDFRGTYAYTNNKITSFVNENWDQGAWSVSENTVFQIAANGNRTNDTSEYSNNSRFINEYTYDSLSLLSDFAHPFADKTGLDYLFESFPYVNKILSKTQSYYDFGTSSYRINSRTTYNYDSAITLSTEKHEVVKASVTVFPNPAASVINFGFSDVATIDKVVIFDVTGNTVLQKEGNIAEINVEKLTSGLYIVEAYFGKDKLTSKFIKK